jgi:hypothetical protein
VDSIFDEQVETKDFLLEEEEETSIFEELMTAVSSTLVALEEVAAITEDVDDSSV